MILFENCLKRCTWVDLKYTQVHFFFIKTDMLSNIIEIGGRILEMVKYKTYDIEKYGIYKGLKQFKLI